MQDIQECKAHALLDINGTLLDIACPIVDITRPTLDTHRLPVLLTHFLPLLLRRRKDIVQPCGGSSTAKRIRPMPLAEL